MAEMATPRALSVYEMIQDLIGRPPIPCIMQRYYLLSCERYNVQITQQRLDTYPAHLAHVLLTSRPAHEVYETAREHQARYDEAIITGDSSIFFDVRLLERCCMLDPTTPAFRKAMFDLHVHLMSMFFPMFEWDC